MHQRVRCPDCHHWTDALLVWAAGDCCPRCNAPISLGEPARPSDSEASGGNPSPWGEDRPWRTPGRLRPPRRLGDLGERR
jgi:hypothetical protein